MTLLTVSKNNKNTPKIPNKDSSSNSLSKMVDQDFALQVNSKF